MVKECNEYGYSENVVNIRVTYISSYIYDFSEQYYISMMLKRAGKPCFSTEKTRLW